jgi:hypothetical protein
MATTALSIDAYADLVVATAPPLSDEQKRRLAVLLGRRREGGVADVAA